MFLRHEKGRPLASRPGLWEEKKPVSVVTAFYIFWLQDGLRIQCVLMVNAKLDPEELPQNTLQVQTDISTKSVNKDQIQFVNKD